MWRALAINVALVGAGLVGAWLTGSVALLADAGHLLSDVLSIGLGLAAAAVAARPPGGRGTFGLGRVEPLAALVNGLALVAVSIWIGWTAIARLGEPPELDGVAVLLFGVVGLLGNVAATVVLVRGHRSDINLEGVLRHSAADALGSLGVVAAGAGIAVTGWAILDPLVGMAIAVLILASSWRLLAEPVNVLLERVPGGVEIDAIGRAILAVSGVREVHDLHVWSITSGFIALSAHVTTDPDARSRKVREAIERELDERFAITHTTLQVAPVPLIQIEDARSP